MVSAGARGLTPDDDSFASDGVMASKRDKRAMTMTQNVVGYDHDDEVEEMAMDASDELDSSTLTSSNKLFMSSADAASELSGSVGRSQSFVLGCTHSQQRQSSMRFRAPQPRRSSNDLSEFTIDKLNYKNLGIHGREEELATLKACWRKTLLRLAQTEDGDRNQIRTKKQFVVISGPSGCGKTRLAESLRQVTEQRGGRFVRGKFDFQHSRQPYSGVAAACAEICGGLIELEHRQSKTQSQQQEQHSPETSYPCTNVGAPVSEEISSSLSSNPEAAASTNATSSSSLHQTAQRMRDELGPTGLAMLVDAFPILAEVVGDDKTATTSKECNSSQPSPSTASSEEVRNQVHFAFLKFLNIVSVQFTSLVMVIDDLQWADGPSLDLLDVLIRDSNSLSPSLSRASRGGGLMVIGIYRSDEVEQNPRLQCLLKGFFPTTFDDMNDETNPSDDERCSGDDGESYQVTKLNVGDLSLEAVNRMIQDLLSCDDNTRTLGLANVCMARTHGNAFFLLNFLKLLHSNKLIQFNLGSLTWTWTDSEIEANAKVTANVVHMLKDKMDCLADDEIHILKLAACLGTTFAYTALELVFIKLYKACGSSIPEVVTRRVLLNDGLERLESEGFLLASEHPQVDRSATPLLQYNWAHDKIHEAALTLIPQDDYVTFAHSVGSILVKNLSVHEHSQDSTLFVAVNLLNESKNRIKSSSDREAAISLAKLNYRASRSAMSVSAFENAAEFAGNGIDLLPEKTCWKDHYDLALQLYSVKAKAEGFTGGNVETMEHCCKAVMAQMNGPLEDKFDVYRTWIDSLANRGDLDKAVELCLEILARCDCHFPRKGSKLAIGFGMARGLVLLKANMNKDVSTLPAMKDKIRPQLVHFMERLAMHWFMSGDDRLPLALFRIVKWTMKYGYCEFSAPSFAKAGVIVNGLLDDIQGGSKYGEQAFKLLEMTRSNAASSITKYATYGSVFAYTKPLRDLVKPSFDNYEVCLRAGDTESAMWSIWKWLTLRFSAGLSLTTLLADSQVYVKQMRDLNRELALTVSLILQQCVLNLVGRDNLDCPTSVFGKSNTAENRTKYEGGVLYDVILHIYGGCVQTYFGDYFQFSAKVIKRGVNFVRSGLVGQHYIQIYNFVCGLSLYASSQLMEVKRKRKQRLKLARIFHGRIKKWVRDGNPNVTHYLALLDAESMVVAGRDSAAIRFYESAVVMAARGGFQQDAALACERYGEFALRRLNDKEEAAYRLSQAVHYWRCWGASAKVQQMEEKHGKIMKSETPQVVAWRSGGTSTESFGT